MPEPAPPKVPTTPREMGAVVLQLWAQAGVHAKEIDLLFGMLTDMAEAAGMRPPEDALTLIRSIAARRERLRAAVARDLEDIDPAAAARFRQDSGRDLPPIDG